MQVQPLVPVNQYDMPPSYYIYGGLVFVPLTQPYIDRSYICECCVKKMPTKAGEQIVIISQVRVFFFRIHFLNEIILRAKVLFARTDFRG